MMELLFDIGGFGIHGYFQGLSVDSHFAALNAVALKCLIAKGANVNARNRHWPTPLHSVMGYFRVALILIQNGADPNVLNTIEQDDELCSASPLWVACKCNHLRVAKALKGADPDYGGHRGDILKTPLQAACQVGNT